VTAEDVQTLRDALTLANGVGYRFDDVLAALDRLVAELQRLQDASDMREMNETEGNEILGEVVAQIEAVSPAPAEMPCACLHCRHHKGVDRLVARLAAAEHALREITGRHPDAVKGEHPAVDIARAALAGVAAPSGETP
jgi:hypothetical protein